jgi:hypothetical protein
MALSGEQAMTAGVAATGQRAATQRYLYGPVTDFLCLGGISLLVLPLLFALPVKEFRPSIALLGVVIAYVLNHPHFAISYQIFYEDFGRKAFGRDTNATLRLRYIFAGIVMPAALVLFMAGCVLAGSAQTLGHAANLMGFLVGWHYAKQGFGMLMVDAALKRQFFNGDEKKILRVNAYAVWALTWLTTNAIMSKSALWGIQSYMLPVPSWVLLIASCVVVATTVSMGAMLVKKWRTDGGRLPWNGVVAYLVTLYVWMIMARFGPLALLLVPALHSLQYLLVATRYQTNRFRDVPDAREAPQNPLLARIFRRRYVARFAGTMTIAFLLGYAGFWALPKFLLSVVPYDTAEFGPALFLFLFWIFINVHHYFLDNVMWRSENPEVRKHLFS